MSQSEKQPIPHLADANIVLRLAQASHPMHNIAREAVKNIKARGDEIVISVQTLFEYWVVATRPATSGDGLGLSTADAQRGLSYFQSLFPCCSEEPMFEEWQRLVVAYDTHGKPAHDARYVAVMKTHGLTHILTFNTKDFARYAPEGIVVGDPTRIATPAPRKA